LENSFLAKVRPELYSIKQQPSTHALSTTISSYLKTAHSPENRHGSMSIFYFDHVNASLFQFNVFYLNISLN
jgi:hypothetical protein